jgi:hypothetical protein
MEDFFESFSVSAIDTTYLFVKMTACMRKTGPSFAEPGKNFSHFTALATM